MTAVKVLRCDAWSRSRRELPRYVFPFPYPVQGRELGAAVVPYGTLTVCLAGRTYAQR